MFILHQIKWSLSKQELLFSDFCEDSDNIEEGAEYNKVFILRVRMSLLKYSKTFVKLSVCFTCFMYSSSWITQLRHIPSS